MEAENRASPELAVLPGLSAVAFRAAIPFVSVFSKSILFFLRHDPVSLYPAILQSIANRRPLRPRAVFYGFFDRAAA